LSTCKCNTIEDLSAKTHGECNRDANEASDIFSDSLIGIVHLIGVAIQQKERPKQPPFTQE